MLRQLSLLFKEKQKTMLPKPLSEVGQNKQHCEYFERDKNLYTANSHKEIIFIARPESGSGTLLQDFRRRAVSQNLM